MFLQYLLRDLRMFLIPTLKRSFCVDRKHPGVGRKGPFASDRLAQFPVSYRFDILLPLVFVLLSSFYFTIKSHEKEDTYAEEGISQVKYRPKGKCDEIDNKTSEYAVVEVSERSANDYRCYYDG